ncbi:MAG TPA: hypothetical protein VGQ81_16405, partial [Acidobacteriota bacterium]|nr:hypothetical protein [Acidobacteriota bacterium]
GLGIFTFKSGNVTVTEAGVPLLRSGSAFRMYAQASDAGSIRTGVAIANLSSSSATVDFELTTLSGIPLGVTGSVVIPGDGQMATFLEQISGFSSLPSPFQGLLRFSSNAPISAVGLRGRVNERGDFLITTTTPVDEELPVASLPVFLPHFVEGGGYSTEFILFSGSAGQSSTGRIEFYGQAGQVLNLPLK